MPLQRPLRRTARLSLAGGLAVALAAVCTGSPAPHEAATRPAATTTASADDAVNYVIAISVDGLNSTAVRQLGRTGTPSLHRLIDNGATTLNARTAYERTSTLPNHTVMVTGRRILGSGGTQVTFNDDNGKTVHASAGGYVKSIFDDVHNHGGSTAMYAAKSKFNFLNRSWNATHGGVDRVGVNNGRDKIDRYYVDDEPTNVTRLITRLRNAPDELSFVHLAYPDRVGHDHGFMSARYLQAVRSADTQLGRILDAVRADTRLRNHANVVLTADHGGLGAGHTDPTKAANYTVPFMVWGVGVARNRNLYDLNPTTRRGPGAGRPTYAGTQPVRNGELANLSADLLDLPTVPGSLFNTRQDLKVR